MFEHDLFGKPLHTFPDHALVVVIAILREGVSICNRFARELLEGGQVSAATFMTAMSSGTR
jgi:hypothetical protein